MIREESLDVGGINHDASPELVIRKSALAKPGAKREWRDGEPLRGLCNRKRTVHNASSCTQSIRAALATVRQFLVASNTMDTS